MADLPARRSTWLQHVVAPVVRALSALLPESEHVAGADYSARGGEEPGYPDLNSMSALGAFPWVRACVLAIADDLAGRPILVLDRRGGDEIENHPFQDLVASPNSQQLWEEFCRQGVVDLLLTGKAWTRCLKSPMPGDMSMIRLHPERTKPVVGVNSLIDGVIYDGREPAIPIEELAWCHDASWEAGPRAALGEGAIRSLHESLNADLAARKMAAKSAKRGRNEMILSPKGNDIGWGKKEREDIARNYQLQAEEGKGVLVVSEHVEATPLNLTPRDLEFASQAEMTRAEVLAVFGVPPTRLGLDTSTFATDANQTRNYWLRLVNLSRLFCGMFTRAARILTDDRRLVVVMDFSDIPALQAARTEQYDRAQVLISLGADRREAFAFEGVDDAPVPEGPDPLTLPLPEPAPAAENPTAIGDGPNAPTQEPQDEQAASVDRYLRGSSSLDETLRAETWRSYIKTLQGPAEKRLDLEMRRFWRGQAKRIADRLAEAGDLAGHERTLRSRLDDVIDYRGESLRLRTELRPLLARLIRLAFTVATRSFRARLEFVPERAGIVELVEQFVVRIGQVTAEVVRQALERMIGEGATIGQMQTALIESVAFSPSRALRVARTETTRAVNRGTLTAYQEAERIGLQVQKEWLTARDGAVRPSHVPMDGQVRAVGEKFKSGAGHYTDAPGGFGLPGEDINCRCTLLPVLEE